MLVLGPHPTPGQSGSLGTGPGRVSAFFTLIVVPGCGPGAVRAGSSLLRPTHHAVRPLSLRTPS